MKRNNFRLRLTCSALILHSLIVLLAIITVAVHHNTNDDSVMAMLSFLGIDFPISLLELPILRLLDLTRGYCHLAPEQKSLMYNFVFPSIVFLVIGGFQYIFLPLAGFKVYSFLLNRSKRARTKKLITYGVVTFFVLLFTWLIHWLIIWVALFIVNFVPIPPEPSICFLFFIMLSNLLVYALTLTFIIICFRRRKKLFVLFWRSR
jgi:hypothetical protein